MNTVNDILITADSTCDLPKSIVEENGIKIFPLSILLGDKKYLDGVDIMPNDIYAYADSTGELPKTAAVPPQAYIDFFKKAQNDGKQVVHIGLSSGISSSFSNARLVSEDFDNVYCVDSKNLCTAMGLLVLKACDFRDAGMSAEQIATELEALVPKVSATFIVNSLNYLHKGGRCSSVAKFGANVLGIKPSIAVDTKNGTMDVDKKYRGKIDVVYSQYVSDCVSNVDSIDKSRIVIANSGSVDQSVLDKAKQIVEDSADFDEIIFADAGCTISSHCGPKTLAVFYIKK